MTSALHAEGPQFDPGQVYFDYIDLTFFGLTLNLHFSVFGALRSGCAGISTVKISFSTQTSPLGLMDKACPS